MISPLTLAKIEFSLTFLAVPLSVMATALLYWGVEKIRKSRSSRHW